MLTKTAKAGRHRMVPRWDRVERRGATEDRLRRLVEDVASDDPIARRRARARLQYAYRSGDHALRSLIENLVGGRPAFATDPVVTAALVRPVRTPGPPKPADEAMRRWMRARIDYWPDDMPAPSEESDWEAAQQYFGTGLHRDDFRTLREGETPAEWRRQGPRPLWGKVKA